MLRFVMSLSGNKMTGMRWGFKWLKKEWGVDINPHRLAEKCRKF